MGICKRPLFGSILVLLIVVTLAFIWGNSMLDRDSSSQLSNGLLNYIKPFLSMIGIRLENDHALRKIAHFCEFSLLGAEFTLLFFTKYFPLKMSFAVASAASLLAAFIDEGIQYFSGRFSHVYDVMLDFSGALFGTACVCLCLHIYNKRIKNKADSF